MPTAHYNRIKAFMQKVGQDTPEIATIPDEKTRILRAKLILEEALETVEALGVKVEIGGHELEESELVYSPGAEERRRASKVNTSLKQRWKVIPLRWQRWNP